VAAAREALRSEAEEFDLLIRPALLEAVWTPTGFVDTIRSGTMVYEERTGRGTSSQEVHPAI
jgi:hypothetical protein